MRLRALLETGSLGLRLLGGEAGLDRAVTGVMTTDLRDPSRYLAGGELVLTGLVWRRAAADSEPFVARLAAAGVAALAVGEAELGAVPGDLVAACARYRLPLFSVSEDVAFATVTEHVARRVSAERAGDLAAVVERHRRLITAGPAGGGPDAVLDLLGSDLDLRAWVLSATGRTVAGGLAGTPPDGRPGARAVLPPPVAARLAGEYLAAARDGRPAPHRVATGGVVYSLFPVRPADPDGGDPRPALLAGWLLAVAADAADWPAERLDLLGGVTRLIAVERERRDAARAVRRGLAQDVLDLVRAGAASAEVAGRLRAAAPVLVPGPGGAPHWQVVVARVEWPGIGRAAGPVARSLLEELPLGGAAPAHGTAGAPDLAERVGVAQDGEEAVALVPVSPVSVPPLPGAPRSPGEPRSPGREKDRPAGADRAEPAAPGASVGVAADALLAAVRPSLERALGDDGRLTVGVSAPVHSAEGLRGALEEARHARRVAAARPGRVCAAGHEELASHVLLLPFVPDDVRRAFTARLLEPLRDYDRRHRADLVATLAAFLAADGSWTRCAARLHLHVNTLRYRVGRIEQLTGRDLSRLEDKLDFFLALRMG